MDCRWPLVIPIKFILIMAQYRGRGEAREAHRGWRGGYHGGAQGETVQGAFPDQIYRYLLFTSPKYDYLSSDYNFLEYNRRQRPLSECGREVLIFPQ